MKNDVNFVEILGFIALLTTMIGIMVGAFTTLEAVLAIVQSIFMLFSGGYTKNYKKH